MKLPPRPARLILALAAVAVIFGLALNGWSWFKTSSSVTRIAPPPPPPPSLDKEELAYLLGRSVLTGRRLDRFRLKAGAGRTFTVETTIDQRLQQFLNSRLARARAPMAAMAVIEPATGKVLALASWDRLPGRINYAVASTFPAASVFKIVTAAAAMEEGGLSPASRIPYHGRSTTLYKGQLRDKKTRWTRYPSLTDSFAKSVNPVFGKLAQKQVGPDVLEAFALRFGFNQALRFEFPAEASRVRVPENDPYQLAEVGSGFNRETTMSPLHGALIAGAVVNGGLMMEPNIVNRVTVDDGAGHGREVYRSRPRLLRRTLSSRTAERMKKLMAATISRGTARSIFRRAKRDRVLKHLEMGGKTGSINDRTRTYRCDWFVGYARHKKTGQTIALAVLVAHDLKRRGVRAARLARQAFRFYFDDTRPPAPEMKPVSAPPVRKAGPSPTKIRPLDRKPSSKSKG